MLFNGQLAARQLGQVAAAQLCIWIPSPPMHTNRILTREEAKARSPWAQALPAPITESIGARMASRLMPDMCFPSRLTAGQGRQAMIALDTNTQRQQRYLTNLYTYTDTDKDTDTDTDMN